MKLVSAAIAVLFLLSACGEEQGSRAGPTRVTLEQLAQNPERYEGRQVRIGSAYYRNASLEVLTSGFRESFPPQPIDPLVTVDSSAPAGCLDSAPNQDVSWTESAVATGTFQVGDEGPDGQPELLLLDSTVSCS
jgi:hypothetical protein